MERKLVKVNFQVLTAKVIRIPPLPLLGASTRFLVMTSHYGASRSHSLDTSHYVILLWISDWPDAGPST